jgi:hypothetical protein
MKYVLLLLSLIYQALFCQQLWAGSIEVFEREYTYNASENDSKVSARKAAMQQLQSLVIQEVGVQVQSSFSQQEALDGDDFSRQVQANYKTFSQALTKTRILKQKWDGESFYLKAEITVDTDNLLDQIKLVYVDSSQPVVKKKDCKTIHNHAIDLLAEANRPEVVEQIVAYSAQYPIDEQCYRWQLGILNDFRTLDLDPAGYRDNLFQRIEDEGSSFAGDLLLHVLRYSLSIRQLSASEWEIVKETLKRSRVSIIESTIRHLAHATKIENLNVANKSIQHSNEVFQQSQDLQQQMAEIVELANQGKLGSPKIISVEKVIVSFLGHTSEKMPHLFFDYYIKNSHLLSKDTTSGLTSHVVKIFKAKPTKLSLNFLNDFLSDIELDRGNRRFLFSFFLDLSKNKHHIDIYPQALASLIKTHPELFAQVITSARYNKQKKELLLIEYQLPFTKVLPVAEYAKGLFDKKMRNQTRSADYLIAFGERALPAKGQVVKRLERIQALKRVTNPRNLIVSLLQVLDNVKAKDQAAIDVMIWALSDLDGDINQKAQASLISIGADAMSQIVKRFGQQKSTARRRLVEVMGTYQKKAKSTLGFLQGIKPDTEQLRFAIEDSMAELAMKRE